MGLSVPWWLSWAVGGASVATTFLLGSRIRWGWRLMLLNQAGWTWIAVGKAQWGLLFSTAVFAWLAIRGHRKWADIEGMGIWRSTYWIWIHVDRRWSRWRRCIAGFRVAETPESRGNLPPL